MARLGEFSVDDTVDIELPEGEYNLVYGNKVNYISDFNKDGIRDIVDATAIQKHLARIN